MLRTPLATLLIADAVQKRHHVVKRLGDNIIHDLV